jgi:hypothetical protein
MCPHPHSLAVGLPAAYQHLVAGAGDASGRDQGTVMRLTSWLPPPTSGWRGIHLMAAHVTVQLRFETEGLVPGDFLPPGLGFGNVQPLER